MQQLHTDFRDPQCGGRIAFPDRDAPAALTRATEERGFAVAALAPSQPPDDALAAVAAALGLGTPYIPALYRYPETRAYSAAYSHIRSDPGDRHPGFSTTAGQAWHVDGLLDEIGTIKTTILYCVRAAHRGGDTLLFNSLAAFAELRALDPDAALAMQSPKALNRRSTIPAIGVDADGPVFARDSFGAWTTRYTDNDTCTWNFAEGPPGGLRRGLEFLRAAAREPRYRLAVSLRPGEALIFRNDRLSHGRQPYEDTPAAPRHLIRALYADGPTPQ
ncbi:putative taurine catabolism dioxygenase [Actinokineospora spheciospongiae]|uniref:Putative taurine catabolism dioxygenase n=1 Tax=Actinokineospora spheciospongiae TaxID=909613 RepID=W7J637_9PSEU|nr:TauD/TfdA family dioxygenase [Actinokineospora spheciospongiae]EWC64477.1 putative taurine catabolism dioxygenase [Actinokineospora spheciospongiae]